MRENKEKERLKAHKAGKENWRKWGTYLSERQWGTVREDYSPQGAAWDYFPHDHARSRAYRWGEDGIAGWSDDHQYLCFAPVFWNGKDPILKERLFGLTSEEGNHGEDVKELYYYLDNSPTHSYARYLYKYPHRAYPYNELVRINGQHSRQSPEYELLDTGTMDENAYFNIFIEYAKDDPDTSCIQITVENPANTTETIYLLPTLWFRNIWDWEPGEKPKISLLDTDDKFATLEANHPVLGTYFFYFEKPDRILFTENETNKQRLYGGNNASPCVKDSFHQAIITNDYSLIDTQNNGTKCAPLYIFSVKGGEKKKIRLLLSSKKFKRNPFNRAFNQTVETRREEASFFFSSLAPKQLSREEELIFRQALSGLLWNKQFYQYEVKRWLAGDPGQPTPPFERNSGRNHTWLNLNASDIICMPDCWEFPWFASWDLAFHAIVMAMIDIDFAKEQLLLFTQDRYQRQDGVVPAYEWNFSDLNPPIRAWATLIVFERELVKFEKQDFTFLLQMYLSCQSNYNWWKKNEDKDGDDIFSGGFLGLDNISLFDRSQILSQTEYLQQADATAWMALFALSMMKMALILAQNDSQFELEAIDYFEDFLLIAEAVNNFGPKQEGLWDPEAGFFFDCLKMPNGSHIPLPVKSVVGLTMLFPVCLLEHELLKKNRNFYKHLIKSEKALIQQNHLCAIEGVNKEGDLLISLIHKDKLEAILSSVLDTEQFLSPFGIRSLSKSYENSFCVILEGAELCIDYEPGESHTELFGGNSNWRGPIWMPINYLLIHSLQKFSKLYGRGFTISFPSYSKNRISLDEVCMRLRERLISIFKSDREGNRPVHAWNPFYKNELNDELLLFYEYYHGNSGRGCGASHQTGWSALVAILIEELYT